MLGHRKNDKHSILKDKKAHAKALASKITDKRKDARKDREEKEFSGVKLFK